MLEAQTGSHWSENVCMKHSLYIKEGSSRLYFGIII